MAKFNFDLPGDPESMRVWQLLGMPSIKPSLEYPPLSGGDMPKLAQSDANNSKFYRSKHGEFVSEFEQEFGKRLIGQTEAVNAIVQALKRHLTKLQAPGRPISNLLFLGQTGSGKAQPLDALIASPQGFLKMEDMHPGSVISGSDGAPQKVKSVHPQGITDMYAVSFIDGRTVRCSGEHLWKVFQKQWNPKWRTISTSEIAEKYSQGLSKQYRMFVPLSANPIEMETAKLPLDPYLLGALLGDGCLRNRITGFSSIDIEILGRVMDTLPLKTGLVQYSGQASCDYIVKGSGTSGNAHGGFQHAVRKHLETLGLNGKHSYDKFIPEIYKYASVAQRMALLQGLMDTDGTVGKKGSISFSSSSRILAADVQEIVWSLGGIARITERKTGYTYKGIRKIGRISYTVHIRIRNGKNLFSLQRKKDRVPQNYQYADRLNLRIIGIERLPDEYTQCISVTNPDGLYITDGYVVTHNTRSIEVATEILFGGCTNAFVKIDCAEFQSNHEISKLLGAPAGYIGHKETSPVFTQDVLNRFHTEKIKMSFVLFDEIEKASDALWQLLLGVLDKGTLTLGDNRKVDFSNCIIVMTSNLGAVEMSKLANAKMGFAPQISIGDIDTKLASVANGAAKKRFTPEFMNRIDNIVVFKALQQNHLKAILELELRAVQERILHAECPAFILEWTDAAVEFLLEHGTSVQYGARELKRTIEKHVVQALTDVLLGVGVDNADTLTIDIENGAVVLKHTPR